MKGYIMTVWQKLCNRDTLRANKPGMTLIELMLVIVVAGIVIGGAFAIFNTLMSRAKLTKTQTVIRAVKGGIEAFHTDTDEYPRTLADLKSHPDGELGKRWQGPYYDKKPVDGWDHPLVYRLTPEADQPYELYSYGSGGKKGKTRIDAWNM